jgi:hypothetical protein
MNEGGARQDDSGGYSLWQCGDSRAAEGGRCGGARCCEVAVVVVVGEVVSYTISMGTRRVRYRGK